MNECVRHPRAVWILAVDRGEVCSGCLRGDEAETSAEAEAHRDAIEEQRQSEVTRRRNAQWLRERGWT